MENISPYQRLLTVLDQYLKENPNHTTTSFERDFDLPNGFFHNAEKSGKPDNEKRLYRVTYANLHNAQPLLNIKWLETGEGEMWLHDETENAIEVSRVGRPYYNVDFLGGFDLMANDQTAIPVSYISMEPYNKAGVYWCNLTGDSMSPLIRSGAKICLKHIEDGVNGIIYGEVYALITRSDMRTVKWVVRSDDEDKVRLVPENRESKYGDFQDIPKSDIISVFKVELAVNPL